MSVCLGVAAADFERENCAQGADRQTGKTVSDRIRCAIIKGFARVPS
jgi:hypothetical protein